MSLVRLATRTSLVLSLVTAAFGQNYSQVNLVSNTAGVAAVTDPSLINPWGLARGTTGDFWVSDEGVGLSTLYNGSGIKNSLVVTIPPSDPNSTTFPIGTPTGVVFSGSAGDFLVSGKPAVFIFSTIDGTVAAWNPAVALAPGANPPSTHAVTVFKTTDGSSYKGITIGFINGAEFLYAANFSKGRVDVFDHAFNPVNLSERNAPPAFTDSQLPPNYVPFNVQTIGDDIVVTYVLAPNGKLIPGPGNGYVDIYNANGQIIQRLESGSFMNAPWGVALAPQDFGLSSHKLLIGQFADASDTENSGTIAIFDIASGKCEGQLRDSIGRVLTINGLWSLQAGNAASPGSYDPAGSPGGELYFTAGVNHETGGLFGYIKPFSNQLIEGNDQ